MDLSTKYTALGTVFSTSFSDRVSPIMPYAFYAATDSIDSIFDFLYSTPPAGSVASSTVQDYIYNYTNQNGNGFVDCNGRELYKDLFEDSVDAGRTMGYNDVNIDLQDTFDLSSYDSNHSWWDKLWDYGFSWPSTDGDYKNVAPIYVLSDNDLNGTDAAISANLLVNDNDVSALKNFYNTENSKGNRVVLFRFASTDYYCAPAFRSGYSGSIDNTDTYVAQQTVFFDFDIIDLTFNKDGVFAVIPAVSSPTDIVNELTPPASELQLDKIAAALFIMMMLIILLLPLIKFVLSILIEIILLPFKLIGKLLTVSKKPERGRYYRSKDDRYERIMREDFPKGFADEDPFVAALLDHLEKK